MINSANKPIDLWRLIDEHFETFKQVYDERFQAKYGYWRPVVGRSAAAFLKCGDLQDGFARVRCPDCKHEMFVAYSCKQRPTCPSCHQKRTLLTAIDVAEEVCFSLSRLVKVTDTEQVVYKAEKDACQIFPDPQADNLEAGAKRNFQILSPLDFLAEFTQHIPPKGYHSIRYFGVYSNKSRDMRKKAEEAAEPSSQGDSCDLPPARCSQTWAMLIKRIYEVDPLACPNCGGQMKVVSFIEPPQSEVIEKILRHCGLWKASAPRGPPDPVGLVHNLDFESMDQTPELTYVDMDTFLATF